MTVYVDALFATKRSRRWPYIRACHMFADTSDELDEIAEKIGLKPQWKKRPFDPSEHYDLTQTRRAMALRFGAREATARQFVEIMQRKQREGCR